MVEEFKTSHFDVPDIASFRWYANRLENLALEIYMADPKLRAQIAEIFVHAERHLKKLRAPAEGFVSESCPVGWCPDMGRCVPCEDGSRGS